MYALYHNRYIVHIQSSESDLLKKHFNVDWNLTSIQSFYDSGLRRDSQNASEFARWHVNKKDQRSVEQRQVGVNHKIIPCFHQSS